MIKIEHVTKYFEDYPVLNDLSLTVPKGSIYGLMGLNGAGKTTTLKACCGLLKPDGGTITVNGIDIQKDPIACKKMNTALFTQASGSMQR